MSAASTDIAAELASINLRLGEIRRQLIGKENPNDVSIEPDTLKKEVDEINSKLPPK